MNLRLRSVFFIVPLACAITPASAHHSAAMFDTSREMLVEGVVEEFNWKNPHSYIAVRTATGQPTLELGPPSTLDWEGAGDSSCHLAAFSYGVRRM
jgi:hypothetical protein